jgi:hypothetical protein
MIGGTVMLKFIIAGLATIVLSGCATSIAYRADYLPAQSVPEESRIDGRALVYTTRADDERLVTAGATSFTGSGAKLTTPIGMIAREVAVKVFGLAASGGATAANELADLERYSIIVRPEVKDFTYGFPQLKNLGFAITPEVRLQLRMSVLDASGRTALEKDYDSGVIEGSSYMLSGSPYERISKLLHQSMYDLMQKAAADVRTYQRAAATSATPAP